jgi:hypothetical protein
MPLQAVGRFQVSIPAAKGMFIGLPMFVICADGVVW